MQFKTRVPNLEKSLVGSTAKAQDAVWEFHVRIISNTSLDDTKTTASEWIK